MLYVVIIKKALSIERAIKKIYHEKKLKQNRSKEIKNENYIINVYRHNAIGRLLNLIQSNLSITSE